MRVFSLLIAMTMLGGLSACASDRQMGLCTELGMCSHKPACEAGQDPHDDKCDDSPQPGPPDNGE
jgi:hypothetical protein